MFGNHSAIVYLNFHLFQLHTNQFRKFYLFDKVKFVSFKKKTKFIYIMR